MVKEIKAFVKLGHYIYEPVRNKMIHQTQNPVRLFEHFKNIQLCLPLLTLVYNLDNTQFILRAALLTKLTDVLTLVYLACTAITNLFGKPVIRARVTVINVWPNTIKSAVVLHSETYHRILKGRINELSQRESKWFI
jgi:hypothetical protein